MLEVHRYREYAADCKRMVSKASEADKQILLNIAHAWEEQARLAEATAKKREQLR